MKKLLLFLAFAVIAIAQQSNTTTRRFPGVPTGTCSFFMLAINDANGDLYDCFMGNWNKVSGGGGGGGSPGSPVNSIQYNQAGSFGGITNFSSDGTNPLLKAIAAPSNPAAGFGVPYEDSTSLNFAFKNAAGTVNHGAQSKAAVSHFFFTALLDTGVFSTAQPACGDLSDSSGGCSMSTTAGGDLSGTLPAPTVTNGSHITNSSIPNSGLVNVSTTVNGTTCTLGSSCTVTGAPSGTAGGDLTGTYPNPTVNNGSHITNSSIPNSGLVNVATTVNSTTCTLGSACTVTAAPSGAAGGDLSGTYPNPGVAKVNGAGVFGPVTLAGINNSNQFIAAALNSGHVYIGNGSNLPADRSISQDASVTNTGVWTNLGLNNGVFAGANGHLVSFGAANVPNDSGIVGPNVVLSVTPGIGVAHFPGSSQTATSSPVVSSDMAVVNTRRVCDIAVGDTTASAITNSQLGPQKRICYIPGASTIVEMDVAADAGTPNVIVGKNTAGSVLNIVSSALATASSGGIACSNTGGTTGIDGATTCSATLQNTSLAAGAYLELVSGTAGGTAKFMTIHVIYTIN